MRSSRVFHAVDSHTEGMPTRVITGGIGPIPGDTMLARKLHFEQHLDELRLRLRPAAAVHAGSEGRGGVVIVPRNSSLTKSVNGSTAAPPV